MKKIFIAMLAAVAVTTSFAQSNPKIDKEVKATKSFEAGKQLIDSKLNELNDEERGKAYDALYKLIQPDFSKTLQLVQAAGGKSEPAFDKIFMQAITVAGECQKYGSKDAAKNMAEVLPVRGYMINAANTTSDNDEKLAYSLCYISTTVPGDQYLAYANFFAAYACYNKKDYDKAATYAKGAFGDPDVGEQAEQVYRGSFEQRLQTRQDTINYANALKELDADKYFVNICNLYSDINEKDMVKNMIESAIAKNPNNKYAYFQRGNMKSENQQFDAAIEDFKKVIEIDPEFVYGWFNLGISYGGKGDEISMNKADKNGRLVGEDLKACSEAYNNGIEAMEKCRALDPNHETVRNWPMQLRMLYTKTGKKDKADEISRMLGDM